MLGLLKLVTIIAASLLLFEALRGFDWASNVHDPAVLLGVDLILQGKQNVAALFDRASWFSAISENAIQIEAGVAAFGAVLLMAANRLTISGFSEQGHSFVYGPWTLVLFRRARAAGRCE